MGGFLPPTGGSAPRPRELLDLIPQANWLSGITGYRFWIRLSPQFTTNVEYKINHISKTENHKIVKSNTKSVSEHFASSGTKKMHIILKILNDHISKTKNCIKPENLCCICYRTFRIFWDKKKLAILHIFKRIFSNHILIVRIDAKSVSEHFASSGTKKNTFQRNLWIWLHLKNREKFIFHSFKNIM